MEAVVTLSRSLAAKLILPPTTLKASKLLPCVEISPKTGPPRTRGAKQSSALVSRRGPGSSGVLRNKNVELKRFGAYANREEEDRPT